MQKVRIDMCGNIFGELSILNFSHLDKKKNAHWFAICTCGIYKTVNGSDVRAGKIISCGHIKAAKGAENQFKHGHAKRHFHTSTYTCWRNMLARCYIESNDRFKNYGGRGIKVCQQWKNSFSSFLSDMGERPLGLTIERINVNGNYEKSNCRWATWDEQRKNTTRSKHEHHTI